MKVGVLTASVSRRAGGLFWALPPLVKGLQRDGCTVRVFAIADQDADRDAAHWADAELDVHRRWGPAAFGYAPQLSKALDAQPLDLVHTHGLWMYPSVAASRWAARWQRPLVVSAHGMLDPWAVRNAAWKKRLAGWLYENRHLERAACLHALNDTEYEAIRRYGLTNPVAVIPNGVDLPEPGEPSARPDWAADRQGRKTLLFLGRLHPKKGLAGLLQAWATVNRQMPAAAGGWQLIIAGWDEGGHGAELRQLVEALKLGETVRVVGPQFGPQKAACLAFADGFVLPSLSEGLPMAVLEAWAHRLPVLMTSQCNLPEGFAAGAALEIALEPDRMAEGLAAFLALPEAERRAIGNRGRRLAEGHFAWDGIAARMAGVYNWLARGGERPACVRVG